MCISSRICRALHLIAEYNEYCCKSHFILGPSLLFVYLCLIVKLLNVKSHQEGACTKVHILNHPASTFSCGAVYILMSVVGMPLPSAGPNAVCGSVHIIMHLQPNTSCPPAPSPAAAWIPSIQSRWRAASSLLLPIRITRGGYCDKQMYFTQKFIQHHVRLLPCVDVVVSASAAAVPATLYFL